MDYSVKRGNNEGDEAVDFGTAGEFGAFGRKKTVTLPKGQVGVIGFTLAPPTTIKEYCAAGKGAAPSYFAYDDKPWVDRCNDDGTPRDYAVFCAAGRDADSGTEELFDKVCTENGTVKAGQDQQPEQRLDRNKLRLSFSESTTQAGGNLHLWLSEEKDGEPIANCGFSTFPEGKWLLSVAINNSEAAEACNLAEGKPYFVMVAFCETATDDINCKAADAKTGLRSGNMSLDPGWYLAQ